MIFDQPIKSTVNIKEEKSADALIALKSGINDLGFLNIQGLKKCNTLIGAFELIGMDFEVEGNDLTNIRPEGREDDVTHLIWSFIAPYITSGSKIELHTEDGIEACTFIDGIMSSELIKPHKTEEKSVFTDSHKKFFSKIDSLTLTTSDIDNQVQSTGDLDFTDEAGNTPLMKVCDMACELSLSESEFQENKKLFDTLMAYNADIDLANHHGETALTISIKNKNLELMSALLEIGASTQASKLNPIEVAFKHPQKDIIEKLLDDGLDPEHTHALNFFCASSVVGDEDMAVIMVEELVGTYQCDVNSSQPDDLSTNKGELRSGWTPLMAAVMNKNLSVIKYLLSKGADPKTQDNRLNTALHFAAGKTWPSGDLTTAWFKGRNNKEIVSLLLEAGADPSVKNASGLSSYELAVRQPNKGAISIIEEYI